MERKTVHPSAQRGFRLGSRLAAGAVLGCLGLLTACGSRPVQVTTEDYVGVCVDPITKLRVPDVYCGGADPYTGAALSTLGYQWVYYPPTYSGVIAAYQQPVIGVPIIHTVPLATSTTVIVIDRGAPTTGGPATAARAAAASSNNRITARPSTSTAAAATTKPPATSAPPPPPGVQRTTSSTGAVQRGGLGVPTKTR